jgi:uncharacterized protein (DUF2062 family)
VKKRLRRVLPDASVIHGNRFLSRFGHRLLSPDLWHLNRRSAAGGIAVGLFCGLIPGPLQMLGAAIACFALRVNLPAALLTTLYSNPLTIVPLYLLAYQLGALVLPGSPAAASVAGFEYTSWRDYVPALIDWVGSLGPPLAVGLPLLAALLAAAGWFAVSLGWRWATVRAWRRRRNARP